MGEGKPPESGDDSRDRSEECKYCCGGYGENGRE